MDLYTFSLTLGGAGLVLMGLSGLGRGHAGGHGGHAGHAGHAHGGHAAGTHGGPGHGHAPAQLRPGERTASMAMALLSPRLLFSVLLGFGAAGLALEPLLGGSLRLLFAVLGGVAFERYVVSPLWNLAFRFASAPALTLESSVEDEARAVTNFDARGQGLIAVELDGQVVQILGTLRREDREAGVRVRAGDLVRIDEVDSARNCCTVRVP